MEYSFAYEALETDISASWWLTPRGAAAEPPRRAAAAPASSRWIFVRDRPDDTALRRYVLPVRQSIVNKRTLVGKVFLPVFTSAAGPKRLTVSKPRSTHLRYTYANMRIPLKNCGTRKISVIPELYTSDCRSSRLNYITGSPVLASARHHREVK